MVLVQASGQRSIPVLSRLSDIHPSPARIFGVAGAIALNVALLMLLLAPVGGRIPALSYDGPEVVTIYRKVQPKKPPVVEVSRPRPTPTTTVQPRVAIPAVELPPVTFDTPSQLDVVVDVPVQADIATASTDVAVDTAPVAGVKLEYAAAPPPAYPRDELVANIQGTVLLQVLVDVDGKPLDVSVYKSSGNRHLDRAAQQQVLRHWSFRPATRDGRAIQAIGIVPIDFKLG